MGSQFACIAGRWWNRGQWGLAVVSVLSDYIFIWLFFATMFLYESLIRTHFYPSLQGTRTFDFVDTMNYIPKLKLCSLMHFPPYQPLEFKNSIYFILKNYMYVYVWVLVCVFWGCVCMCVSLWACVYVCRCEEGVGCPIAEITGSCELKSLLLMPFVTWLVETSNYGSEQNLSQVISLRYSKQ